jgi:hypothetical protein
MPFPCHVKGRFTHTMPFPCHVKGRFTHTMPFPCRFPTVPLPRPGHYPAILLQSPSSNYLLLNYHNRCAVNYTGTHLIAPNNKLLLVHDKRCFVSHWPPASEIDMPPITNFLELHVVAGRRRKLAGHQHAVSARTMLIHTYHAVPMPSPCRDPAVALRGRFKKGVFVAWQGNGMGTAWYV